ncbi:unnamed protein product, partial [Symbiodinium pilosum]
DVTMMGPIFDLRTIVPLIGLCYKYWLMLVGGGQVADTAERALRLFDEQAGRPGWKHTQSQRFLSPRWTGLGADEEAEAPLRPLAAWDIIEQ